MSLRDLKKRIMMATVDLDLLMGGTLHPMPTLLMETYPWARSPPLVDTEPPVPVHNYYPVEHASEYLEHMELARKDGKPIRWDVWAGCVCGLGRRPADAAWKEEYARYTSWYRMANGYSRQCLRCKLEVFEWDTSDGWDRCPYCGGN